ncbi:ABC transporter permease subunit [Streptomyces sp. NPDC001443]
MIQLTWRQFRTSAFVALGAIILVTAFALATGPDLAHAYAATMKACRSAGDCTSAAASFARTDRVLSGALGTLVSVVPALIGAFWGAPLLAREIESGTLPLVWTQSVTRTRWLVTKLVTVGAAGMVTAGLLSLVVTWWAHPLDQAGAAAYDTFGERDLVPVGYAALAFMVGATAGTLIRRTVPAMAATVFAFVAVRVTLAYGIRPRIIGPVHQTKALDPASTGFGSEVSPSIVLDSLFNGGPSSALQPAAPDLPDAWVYSTRVVDASGHDLTNKALEADCPGQLSGGGGPSLPGGHGPVPAEAQQRAQACVSKIGATYHELVTYQPADRYWAFQWAELAVCGATALLLGGFCVWWVRRRRIA